MPLFSKPHSQGNEASILSLPLSPNAFFFYFSVALNPVHLLRINSVINAPLLRIGKNGVSLFDFLKSRMRKPFTPTLRSGWACIAARR